MNRKTTYLIPAFVAVFALMFTVATPLAMAEYSEGMHDKGVGQKQHKMPALDRRVYRHHGLLQRDSGLLL